MSREIPPQKKTNFPLGIRTPPHNARFLGRLSHVSAPINGISIGPSAYAQLPVVTDGQTNGHTQTHATTERR